MMLDVVTILDAVLRIASIVTGVVGAVIIIGISEHTAKAMMINLVVNGIIAGILNVVYTAFGIPVLYSNLYFMSLFGVLGAEYITRRNKERSSNEER